MSELHITFPSAHNAAKVIAVCTSPAKGTQKTNCHSAVFIEDWGIDGDAHAGKWHRQVSLLSADKIDAFRAKPLPAGVVRPDIPWGAFGENLVVRGIDFRTLPLGTRFSCGEVLLELTQIGKECHDHCAIHKAMGECIMPREGVFARVLHGGTIREGDTMTYTLPFTAAVITVSDSGAAGTRQDASGPAVKEALESFGYTVSGVSIIPDEQDQIAAKLAQLADSGTVQLIVTTGGTGFSERDVTPEATKSVITREVPGIPEAMRQESLKITPRAMLSRAAAGIRGKTLIINLPGSPKACRECLGYILQPVTHGLGILAGTEHNCAR